MSGDVRRRRGVLGGLKNALDRRGYGLFALNFVLRGRSRNYLYVRHLVDDELLVDDTIVWDRMVKDAECKPRQANCEEGGKKSDQFRNPEALIDVPVSEACLVIAQLFGCSW